MKKAARNKKMLNRILPRPSLSAREDQVVLGLADGLAYKQIAHRLGLSVNTVKHHIHHSFVKLGVASALQAVALKRCVCPIKRTG